MLLSYRGLVPDASDTAYFVRITKDPLTLPDTAVEEICRLKEKYPRLNATQIHIRLVQNAFIPATVSVDAVQRFIRNNGLRSSREITRKDRKAFEEDSFGRLWQADTCHFCYINDETDKKSP